METTFQIITGLLSIAVPFLLYKIQRQNDEIKAIREKVSDKQFKAYTDMFDLFFELFKEQIPTLKTSDKRVNELIEIQKSFLIYASDNVLNKYIDWKESIGKSNAGNLLPLLELFPLIRKDMGHKDTTFTAKDMLKILMNGNENVDAFYKAIKDEYEGSKRPD